MFYLLRLCLDFDTYFQLSFGSSLHVDLFGKYLRIGGDFGERIFSSVESYLLAVAAYIDAGVSFFKFVGIFVVIFPSDIFAEDSYACFALPVIDISACINILETIFLVAMLYEQNEAVSAVV